MNSYPMDEHCAQENFAVGSDDGRERARRGLLGEKRRDGSGKIKFEPNL